MSLNNIKSVGDDQAWKAEAERIIKDLQKEVAILKSQITSQGAR